MQIMQITLGRGQFRFLNSKSHIACGITSRGGGKSYIGAFSVFKNMIEFPMSVGMCGAANSSMISSVVGPALLNLIKQADIPYVSGRRPDWDHPEQKGYHQTLSIPNGSIVLFRSFNSKGADKAIRGNNLNYFWLDEARELERGIFEDCLATLRREGGPYTARLTTTPAGYDWIYDRFASPNKVEDNELIRWEGKENQRNLPPNFYEQLRSQMSPSRYAQEVLAQFIEGSGSQVYSFTDANIKPCQPWEDVALIFSLDLNVSPLCGVVMQVHGERKEIQVLDEIIIEQGGKTIIACQDFLQKWGPIAKKLGLIYGCDESGANASTRNSESDVTIMRSVLESYGRSYNPFSKPLVVDRVNRTNGFLCNANNEHKMHIDPKCKRTIEDFRHVKWQQGVEPRKLDKRDGLWTHCSDAATYPIVALLGVKDCIIQGFTLE